MVVPIDHYRPARDYPDVRAPAGRSGRNSTTSPARLSKARLNQVIE